MFNKSETTAETNKPQMLTNRPTNCPSKCHKNTCQEKKHQNPVEKLALLNLRTPPPHQKKHCHHNCVLLLVAVFALVLGLVARLSRNYLKEFRSVVCRAGSRANVCSPSKPQSVSHVKQAPECKQLRLHRVPGRQLSFGAKETRCQSSGGQCPQVCVQCSQRSVD